MGLSDSQPVADLTQKDIQHIVDETKVDQETIELWYEKLKAACPSGKISKSDTVIFLRSLNSGKEERIQAQATEIYQAFDVNGDGVVDIREFLIGFILTSSGNLKETLRYVFRTYDHDKDGYIDKKEIDLMCKALQQINRKRPDRERRFFQIHIERFTQHFLPENDENVDVKISVEQFTEFLSNNIELCDILSPFKISRPAQKQKRSVPLPKRANDN